MLRTVHVSGNLQWCRPGKASGAGRTQWIQRPATDRQAGQRHFDSDTHCVDEFWISRMPWIRESGPLRAHSAYVPALLAGKRESEFRSLINTSPESLVDTLPDSEPKVGTPDVFCH